MDLRLVSKRQRFLIWCILLSIVLTCMSFGISPYLNNGLVIVVWVILIWAMRITIIVGVVLLMSALGRHIVWRVFYCLLCLVPLINLILLLLINNHANKVLKKAGVRVGLMGARDEDVRRIVESEVCSTCGYDLTGNVSGVCPECGVTIGA